jgi:hypothetical protein
MDNPKSRLSLLHTTSQSLTPPSDLTRPTEASKAKNKTQDQANFALENLYEKILEDCYDSWITTDMVGLGQFHFACYMFR